jgi:hypothetical protein
MPYLGPDPFGYLRGKAAAGGSAAPTQGGGGPVTPLGPTSASYTAGAAPGSIIASITGLQAGESISSVTPNDGRLALAAGGTQLVVGLSASSAGSINAVLTSSTGRTLNMALTVNAAVSPLRVGSVENRINVGVATRGKTNCVVRWPHFIATDLSDIILSFSNWWNASGESIPGNSVTIIDAALENESGSVVVPVTFSGGRLRVLADGENDAQSDALLPSQFGLSKFSRGELYWFKARYSVPLTTDRIPYSDRSRTSLTGSQASWYDPAVTAVTSTDVAGAYTATGTAFDIQNNNLCPILLGHPIVDGKSFIACGDSIGAITGDNSNTQIRMGAGFIQRSMHDANALTNPLPCLNFCRVGNAYQALTDPANTRWRSFIKYAKHAIDEMGTNNLGISGTDWTAQEYSDYQTTTQSLWSIFRANGISKIIRTQFLARTASTDQWATLANQTPNVRWAAGGRRDQLHAWFVARQTAGEIDYVVDMAPARDPSDTNKWPVNGTANYPTVDGTHPAAFLHEIMAVQLRSALAQVN